MWNNPRGITPIEEISLTKNGHSSNISLETFMSLFKINHSVFGN